MHYELNVSLNGKHLFATTERSIRDDYTAALLLTLFQEKFPEVDGYKVTCTRWENVGHHVNVLDLMQSASNKG